MFKVGRYEKMQSGNCNAIICTYMSGLKYIVEDHFPVIILSANAMKKLYLSLYAHTI